MNSASDSGRNLILAIETSGDVCGVAVLINGECVVQYQFAHGMHLSERLLGIISNLLGDVGAHLEDVNGFAVGIGPGSFTGTRIGVMTVKTLALVKDRPIIGIDGLRAMADSYSGLKETLIAPVLPCRKEIVFAGLYRVGDAAPETVLDPAALAVSDLFAAISAQSVPNVVVCGLAGRNFGADLTARLAERNINASVLTLDFPEARAIGKLAYQRIQSGEPLDDPMTLVPLYLAPPPISSPKQPFATRPA